VNDAISALDAVVLVKTSNNVRATTACWRVASTGAAYLRRFGTSRALSRLVAHLTRTRSARGALTVSWNMGEKNVLSGIALAKAARLSRRSGKKWRKSSIAYLYQQKYAPFASFCRRASANL